MQIDNTNIIAERNNANKAVARCGIDDCRERDDWMPEDI
jgi:hypothetical protein